MKENAETGVQWIYNHVRYMLRALQARPRTRAGRERLDSNIGAEWVAMCWDVGHSLVMMQAHGIETPEIIKTVSGRLRSEFPDAKDLDPAGFARMRQFYLDYFERPRLLPRLREIAWECHLLIQERCRDPMQQEFYLELCADRKLRREGLAKAMESRAYELSAA